MKIGFFGCGAIGSAISDVHESFGHEIFRHDIRFNTTTKILLDCEVILVCLPTPQATDGRCDLTIIEKGLDELEELGYTGTVVMKSTVPPGSGVKYSNAYKFEYISSPEFLREHNAVNDYLSQKIHIFGSSKKTLPDSIRTMMQPLSAKVLVLPFTDAELVKYFHNTYNAWRIIFANAFCDMAERMGANYSDVLNSVCELNQMDSAYLKSNKNFRGFGGPCLPKDTSALSFIARELSLRSNVWELCLNENAKWETTLPPGLRAFGFQSVDETC